MSYLPQLRALTATEVKVIKFVASYGATRTARLNRHYGPGWRGLVAQGLVTTMRTVMGEVAVLSPQGIAALTEVGRSAPRLLSPGAAADRAYQIEVLARLMQQGYSWRRELTVYKRQSRGLGQRGDTSIITALTVQVPDEQYRLWGTEPPDRKQPLAIKDKYGIPMYYRGMPTCYATISNGGIKLARIKALHKVHTRTGTSHVARWRHGVIIAVPEETPDIRQYVRHYEAETERRHQQYLQSAPAHDRARTESLPRYPSLVILEVPAPQSAD